MPARSTAEMWTNTSLPPSLGWMKPKPLVALNHFTVPVAISLAPWQFDEPQTHNHAHTARSLQRSATTRRIWDVARGVVRSHKGRGRQGKAKFVSRRAAYGHITPPRQV